MQTLTMQHQISYGIMNEKEKVCFVNYIKQVDTQLTKLQADKIGISPSILKKRIIMIGGYLVIMPFTKIVLMKLLILNVRQS